MPNKPTILPEASRRNTSERGIMKATVNAEMVYQMIPTKERQTPLQGARA